MKNPFELLLGSANREAYHDHFISWMADPTNDHGQGDLFVRLWMKQVFGVDWTDTIEEVRNEYQIAPGSFVDTAIIGKKALVLIENKVSMGAIRPGQIPKYEQSAAGFCGKGKMFYLTLLAPMAIKISDAPTVNSVSWSKMIGIIETWSKDARSKIPWLDMYIEFAKGIGARPQAIIGYKSSGARKAPAKILNKEVFFDAIKKMQDQKLLEAHERLFDFLMNYPKLVIQFSEGQTKITYNAYVASEYLKDTRPTVLIGVYHDGTVWKDRADLLTSKLGISPVKAHEFRTVLTKKVTSVDIDSLRILMDELLQ